MAIEWHELTFPPINLWSFNMAVENTLEERGKRYGEFSHHALISQDLKMIIHRTDGWKRLGVDQAEALDMIMHKIARILNGDPNYMDSWHDIAGYATLVEQRLTTGSEM